jgi:hypothetical protein
VPAVSRACPSFPSSQLNGKELVRRFESGKSLKRRLAAVSACGRVERSLAQTLGSRRATLVQVHRGVRVSDVVDVNTEDPPEGTLGLFVVDPVCSTGVSESIGERHRLVP